MAAQRTEERRGFWLIIASLIILAYFATIGASIGGSYLLIHQEQLAQQRQGALVELKLCATLDKLAALQPPAGKPADNPSRAYLQELHATLAELRTDLGCPS